MTPCSFVTIKSIESITFIYFSQVLIYFPTVKDHMYSHYTSQMYSHYVFITL